MSQERALFELVNVTLESPEAMRAWAIKRWGKGCFAAGGARVQAHLDIEWNAAKHPLPMLQLIGMVHPQHVKAVRAELGTHLRACPVTRGGAIGALTSSACKRCARTVRHVMRDGLSWDALFSHSATWREQQAARAGQPAPGLPEALAAMRARLAPHAAELDAQRALDDLESTTDETTRTT